MGNGTKEPEKSRLESLLECLRHRNILILGFGREGKSSYAFLQRHLPGVRMAVADANSRLEKEAFPAVCKWHLGKDYLQAVSHYDLVLQSPGVCLKDLPEAYHPRITSQTDLFLQAFGAQCIGITGTKGKSTTSTLLYHLLKKTGHDVLFGGNIGTPLFELIPQISRQTTIVTELSCHQLEFSRHSPHIALLLNLFEEHLDHYASYEAYQLAKYHIALHQQETDYFLFPKNNKLIDNLLKTFPIVSCQRPFSTTQLPGYLLDKRFPLTGNHNKTNALAALSAAMIRFPKTSLQRWIQALYRFKGLPHRLEFVGNRQGILFYNDSISTIPQATIAAVESLEKVDTLLLGGMDRGIDYTPLKKLFAHSGVRNFLFTGAAGQRMLSLVGETNEANGESNETNGEDRKYFAFFDRFSDMVKAAVARTRKGHICLLSPAAPSYDAFKNFEERGEVFKSMVLEGRRQKTEDRRQKAED